MLDAKKLLEQFLGPQASQTGGGFLGDLARQAASRMQGGPPPAPSRQPGGPWGAPSQQSQSGASPLDAVQGALGGLGKSMGGLGGGLAAGGLLAVLLGSKKARKLAGGAMGYGAAAVLGALAHRAYQNWQAGKPPTAPGPDMPIDAQAEEVALLTHKAADGSPFALALILAMIGAANADGHIDATEQKAIFDAVERGGLGAEEKGFVFDALRRPPSVQDIAAKASGQEQAAELWLAARLGIDPDHPSERAWLDALGRALGLPAGLVAHLESQVVGAA